MANSFITILLLLHLFTLPHHNLLHAQPFPPFHPHPIPTSPAPSPTIQLNHPTPTNLSDRQTIYTHSPQPSPSPQTTLHPHPNHTPPPNFTINQHFLAPSQPPFILLPHRLLDAVLTPSASASASPSADHPHHNIISHRQSIYAYKDFYYNTPQDCNHTLPTKSCCDHWYIPDTLQHTQCIATATNTNTTSSSDIQSTHSDNFNVADESQVSLCLYRNKKPLSECCHWLAKGNSPAAQTCIQTRRNIMQHGIRVCLVHDPIERANCCAAIFKGRSLLYHRCLKAIPTFINRQAPCVFKDITSQKLCCQQLFPSAGLYTINRAYMLCANVVYRKTIATNICYEKDPALKEDCCADEKLYGTLPYDKCINQSVPPCRLNNFTKREECCHAKFPTTPWDRTRCMVREFKRCQLHGWKDRLACCASLYRVGSKEMKQCVYQYISSHDVFYEDFRIAHCGYRHPPGSQNFKDCLWYPIKSCQLTSHDDPVALKTCCTNYFEPGEVGFNVCLGHSSFDFLVSTYYDKNEAWRPLSNQSQLPEERVSYCVNTFGLDAEPWYRYACLSEITFTANDPSLYHFALFSDTAVLGHAQFACAVFDEVEREACCSVSYPTAGKLYETCMSWMPTLGYEDYDKLSTQTEEVLEAQLTEVVHRPEAESLLRSQPVSKAEESIHRKRVVLFLGIMKKVEDYLAQGGPRPVPKSMEIAEEGYKEFRNLMRKAIGKMETGTFYHSASKSWITCALVRSESADDDQGVLYCANLRLMDERKVPKRKPVRGWDGGAIERIAQSVNNNLGTVRLFGRNNGKRSWHTSMGQVSERQEGTEPTSSPDESSEAVVVNLFGDSETCPLSNLAFTCNALCCDSYFSDCWICGWQNLQCVG